MYSHNISIITPTKNFLDSSQDQSQNEFRSEDQTRSRAWKPSLLIIGLIIFVLIAVSVFAILFTTHASESHEPCPYSNTFESILAPYSINIAAHEAITHGLHDSDRLQSLISIQAQVSSSSKNTSQKLFSSFGRANKLISNKPPGLAFLAEINSLHQQVRYTISNVSKLSDFYQSLEFAYHTLDRTAVDAYQTTQPGNSRHSIISAESHLLKNLGLDARRAWWDTGMERKKKLEEVQLAIIALKRESERLQQITQTLQSLDISLLQLPIALLKESVNKGGRLSIIKCWVAQVRSFWGAIAEDSDTDQTRLKEWFREHVACLFGQDQENLTDEEFNSWWKQVNCGLKA